MNYETCRKAFEEDLTENGATPEHLKYNKFGDIYYDQRAQLRWQYWKSAWKAALVSVGLGLDGDQGR